jgi:hypothetical protein
MRLPAILAATAALAGCTAAPAQNQVRSPEAQRTLDRYLTGKTAGAARDCLPRYSADDMVTVDDNTLLFRDGSRRVWLTTMAGGCYGLGRGTTALITRQFGTDQLCRGEIAQVIDTSTRNIVGSCSFGDFVPYAGAPTR